MKKEIAFGGKYFLGIPPKFLQNRLTSSPKGVILLLHTEVGCNFFVWSFTHGYEIDENEGYVRVYGMQEQKLRQLQE